jgi:hypothetical protein
MRLSRASGLRPRCFSLPELHKVGQQVMGGGFGDLWQGLVCGQSVSVKMMRVFKNAHIDAILKVCLSMSSFYYQGSKVDLIGIQSRSSHLASTVSSQRTSVLWCILFGEQVVSGLAVDGKREHDGIFNKRKPMQDRPSLTCKYILRWKLLILTVSVDIGRGSWAPVPACAKCSAWRFKGGM